MADIKLTVNGENRASGAMEEAARGVADLGEKSKKAAETSAEANAKAIEIWHQLGESVKRVIERVIEFGKESVAAYAESERISRQLERAAGDLAGAFEQQSKALSERLAIDDDVIKNQQTMLLQWGAAPKDIEKATVAILDYAAATGKDAQTATVEFIKAVETGGGRLKALGIDFEVTGNKTKDLEALTASLAKKFGGAADTDAQSLAGSLRSTKVAWEDFSKALGEALSTMAGSGAFLHGVTEDIRGLQVVVKETSGAFDSVSKWVDDHKYVGDALKQIFSGVGSAFGVTQAFGGLNAELDTTSKNLKALAEAPPTPPAIAGDKPLNGNNTTAKAKELEAAQKQQDEAYQKALDAQEKHDREAIKEDERFGELMAESERKRQDEYARELEKSGQEVHRIEEEAFKADMKMLDTQMEERAKAEKAALERHTKMMQESIDRDIKEMEDAEKKWKHVGDELGAALVNGIATQLEKLSSGGEIDAGEMVGDILATVFAVASVAIGTYLDMPAVGAAVGNLGAVGIRAATRKGSFAHMTFHDGGWVGDVPRYHDGSWIGPTEQPAILQHGERVLSRAEVQSMGGPQRVDQAAKGGGARMVINVSSLDAKSTAEAFEDRSGRGLLRAIRSGHGDVARLFAGAMS